MNRGYCNSCGELVPATPRERGEKVFLVKECDQCGTTETLISGSVERYMTKRGLDSGYDYKTCLINCLECRHRPKPTIFFVDVTNRCNMNCPICINNTPGMGFLFEPPIEYFEKVFEHLSHDDPPPAVQLFGGEPTVREDLFDIIRMAKSRSLPTRVVTNGLKLADDDYCRRLIETEATILIAYDGSNPETYRVLRNSEKSLSLKRKALDNIGKIGGAKVGLMMCVAKDFNEKELPEVFAFCHERRDYIRGIYFMPLVQTWDLEDFRLEPDRITNEDIETAVDMSFPGERVDFIPAGCLGDLSNLLKLLNIKPPPFRGAHPNCESMYLLVSDGECYRPLSRYLKSTTTELIKDLIALEARLAPRPDKVRTGLQAKISVLLTLKRHIRLGSIVKGHGLGKVGHTLAGLWGLLMRRKSRRIFTAHSNIQGALQLIILPFEDNYVLESDRLERCPNAFAFLDPGEDKVKTVPVCAWAKHKPQVLKKIADFYAAKETAQA